MHGVDTATDMEYSTYIFVFLYGIRLLQASYMEYLCLRKNKTKIYLVQIVDSTLGHGRIDIVCFMLVTHMQC